MTDDRQARWRAIEETARSMIVEASAGTGKTSTLIGRILHLVLRAGPDGPPLRLGEVCAITFTEKAAGEMKIRLRSELEKISRGPGELADLARRRLGELDGAAVSTFHAFAVSLLKERPFEAGLDPQFDVLDEVQGEIHFREVWESWLEKAIAARHALLEEALRAGMRLETLRELARTLRRHSGSVRELRLERPMTDDEVRRALAQMHGRGCEFAAHALDPDDRLSVLLRDTLARLAEPSNRGERLAKAGNVGARRNWQGGEETVRAVRAYVREARELLQSLENLERRRVLDRVIRWLIAEFLPEWAERKRAGGFLDFADQLRLARDLLRHSRAARRDFQKRYRTLLVDEFQDTDPLQLEILLLLTSTDLEETDVRRLKPAPGRLFVVGDPKQSIYRFRGADVETYEEVVEEERARELGLCKVALTANMRSVPSILAFVDAVFGDLMARPDDGRYQPEYLPFGGAGLRQAEERAPSVCILGERNAQGDWCGSGAGFFEVESERIAAHIAAICAGGECLVEDRGSGGGMPGKRRPPAYGDIAVLLPVLTHADILEDALRRADIPYVLEGGKFYYRRSEVSSAITVLRAVANPNDAVALYGSLRSVFFGLSDEELLAARLQGVPLDYRSPVPAQSPLSRPYQVLHELHRGRHRRSAAETFEMLLQNTGAREVIARRGFQSLANLAKLGRTLRALERGLTFSQVVELVGIMDEEGAAESESRLMEERGDAVRVMSIHRAKGLDFPIVYVAGLGFRVQGPRADFLAEAHELGTFALRVRIGEESVTTPGWEELQEAERKRSAAELIRLLYVALTRARDHLFLCVHHKGKPSKETGGWIAAFEGTRLEPLAAALRSEAVLQERAARIARTDTLQLREAESRAVGGAESDRRARLRREYRELEELIAGTPSSIARTAPARAEDLPAPEGEAGDTARARHVRLGIAFHEAMERVDLLHAANLDDCAARAAGRHRLDPQGVREMRAMMRCCLDSALMARVRAAAGRGARVLRELPFVRSFGDGDRRVLEEGKIDLLFEDEKGWVLVDYKTDRPGGPPGEIETAFLSRYAAQVREYRAALAALGIEVRAAYLLSARTGAAVEVPPVAGTG